MGQWVITAKFLNTIRRSESDLEKTETSMVIKREGGTSKTSSIPVVSEKESERKSIFLRSCHWNTVNEENENISVLFMVIIRKTTLIFACCLHMCTLFWHLLCCPDCSIQLFHHHDKRVNLRQHLSYSYKWKDCCEL